MLKKKSSLIWLFFSAIFVIGSLTGCSSLPGGQKADEAATATPLPAASSEDGYSVQPSDACLVSEDAVIKIGKPLGNLLAWQPDEDRLAFVAPVGRSWGWSVGDALVASIGAGEPVNTNEVQVAGDLTWSPDGVWLGFVALRLADNQYTIEVWRPTDGSLIDLFPQGATTDTYASRKGIVKWLDGNTLQIAESCGVDCSRLVQASVLGGEQRVLKEMRQVEDTSLQVDLNQPKGITLFANWLSPNVSPDKMSVFFSDANNTSWIGNIEEQMKYPLDLKGGSVQESKWSSDSRYLAVRTEEKVLVFQVDCRENPPVKKLSQPTQ